MSRYSDKKKARAMEAATLAALDAVETGGTPAANPPPAPQTIGKRRDPVPLGTTPRELAMSAEACLAAARMMARTAADLEAKASKGIQRAEATSMAGMAKGVCVHLQALADRARRYAATWADLNPPVAAN